MVRTHHRLAWLIAIGLTTLCAAQTLPPSPTVLPIKFDVRVDASRAKVGDLVAAQMLQTAPIAGHVLRRGSKLVGHVVAARGFAFDPTPYATQHPSILAIHFDTAMSKDGAVRFTAWARALADRDQAQDASDVRYHDEYDAIGLVVQVGGDRYRPNEDRVFSMDDDVVAYRRNGGIFAHLLSGEYRSRYSHFQCNGSTNEVPVAVFSANACGLYGFSNVYLVDDGRGQQPGTFQLESRRQAVRIDRGSAALLQVISTQAGDLPHVSLGSAKTAR